MRKPLPGDFLLRPVPIIAGVVLALNDHVLKRAFGGTVTGKLSDAAGLVLIPLLALAVVELLRSWRHKEWPYTRRDLVIALALVGLALATAKLSVTIAHGFGDVGGWLRWPFRQKLGRVTIAHDPTDLLTLPALAIAWFEGSATILRRKSASRQQPCKQTSSSEVPT